MEDGDKAQNIRLTLHVLQPDAKDKENLVGRGRPLMTGRDKHLGSLEESSAEVNEESKLRNAVKKKKANKAAQTTKTDEKVSVSDLTTEDAGEGYWKALAEKRRVALEESLHENAKLHKQVKLLEKEKSTIQTLLDEAKNIIEILNEIIRENEEEDESTESDDGPVDYSYIE